MAFDEMQQTARVGSDHRVIIELPSLPEGTTVQVTVHKVITGVVRKAGSAKGLIKTEPGFDDAIEGFEDYTS